MQDWVKRIRAAAAAQERSSGSRAWMPAADVYRTAEGWLVKFELAGVRTGDVTVTVQGRSLFLSGTRRDWSHQEGRNYQSMEISYTGFHRRIEFPCELEGPQVELEFRDGMLLVHLRCGGAR